MSDASISQVWSTAFQLIEANKWLCFLDFSIHPNIWQLWGQILSLSLNLARLDSGRQKLLTMQRKSPLFPLRSALIGFCFVWSWVSKLRDFDSIIPFDVVGMKSYMDSLFDPTYVPAGVTINKLNLAPNRNMPRFISVLRNRRGESTSKPYVSVMFFYPFTHWSPCEDLKDVRLFQFEFIWRILFILSLVCFL